MNKYITMLLLGVVGAAMVLVLGVHMRQLSNDPGKNPANSEGQTITAPVQDTARSESPAGGQTAGGRLNGPASTEPQGGATPQPADATSGAPSSASSASSAGSADSIDPVTGQDIPPDIDRAETRPTTGGEAGTGGPTQPAQPDQSTRPAQSGQPAQATRPPAASQTRPTPSAADNGDKTASVTRGKGSIKNMELKFRGKGMYLLIEADSALPAKYFLLHNPERLVVDLPGAWNNIKAPRVPSSMLVKSARLGRQSDADRLVLDLGYKLKFHDLIRVGDKKVEIYFE